jgi:4-alpha-glucanotransferase/alpha-amylase
MNKKVSLLFGVHAHQPAGNFDHVLNDAHARCYKPFIETVYRYPDFAVGALQRLAAGLSAGAFPGGHEKLREMVARGQVEMFGGGDIEPVLASIPERDRRSSCCVVRSPQSGL